MTALIKPVVLLSELLDKREINSQKLLNSATTTIKWIPLEQTEPLNLSVNGQLIPVVKFYIDEAKSRESSDDDDVIFVKEYKPTIIRKMESNNNNKAKTLLRNRRSLKNSNTKNKGEPIRRNPVRKARNAKRFKEFTSLDDEDFTNESEDEETSPSIALNSSGEDAQDWNENDLKKPKLPNKTRKVLVNKKPVTPNNNHFVRTGRRRKLCNFNEAERKVTLGSLEGLVHSNLVLLKDFARNVNWCSENYDSGIKSSAVIEMIKNQALLLGLTRNVKDLDVSMLK